MEPGDSYQDFTIIVSVPYVTSSNKKWRFSLSRHPSYRGQRAFSVDKMATSAQKPLEKGVIKPN